MNTAWIGLGANQGERIDYLREALRRLEREPLMLGAVSPLYETEPLGGPPQGHFLNGCASIQTALSPMRLLRRLQAIEKNLGRRREKRWGPRTIDLDLLIFDKIIMRTPALELPHPRLAERHFVLRPLADIAPHLEIPGKGASIIALLDALPPGPGIQPYRLKWYEPQRSQDRSPKGLAP